MLKLLAIRLICHGNLLRERFLFVELPMYPTFDRRKINEAEVWHPSPR